MVEAAGAWRGPLRLFAHQICRRPQRPRRRRSRRRQDVDHAHPDDAQHHRHNHRSEHRLDASPKPRDAGAPNEPRRRECRQGLRLFREHPKVESVGYLGFLEEHGDPRQADIYRRHCTGAGSTFSLYLKGGEAEAFAFLDNLSIAHLAVSLGGTETLASAPAAMTHLSVPDERKQALGITDNLVRISIGVENADDLIADFENALRAV